MEQQPQVPLQREVKWVKVAERWTRISIMANSSGSVLSKPVDQHEEDSINFLMIPGMIPPITQLIHTIWIKGIVATKATTKSSVGF
jgi:hypothetical protein